ncbi:hypothetical protein B1H29_32830 [Streptomyces pactum]|uniref:Uncharacterized protein n=1 Tax=Streptomyces pactum TaxID=68249 RepID=A0A1S6JH37_9ACTN|nr:hypothetical protein B1H29_32830 [Streptomyces pactum]
MVETSAVRDAQFRVIRRCGANIAASRQPIGRPAASAFSIIGTRYGSVSGNASFLRSARLFFRRYCANSARYRLLSGFFPAGIDVRTRDM